MTIDSSQPLPSLNDLRMAYNERVNSATTQINKFLGNEKESAYDCAVAGINASKQAAPVEKLNRTEFFVNCILTYIEKNPSLDDEQKMRLIALGQAANRYIEEEGLESSQTEGLVQNLVSLISEIGNKTAFQQKAIVSETGQMYKVSKQVPEEKSFFSNLSSFVSNAFKTSPSRSATSSFFTASESSSSSKSSHESIVSKNSASSESATPSHQVKQLEKTEVTSKISTVASEKFKSSQDDIDTQFKDIDTQFKDIDTQFKDIDTQFKDIDTQFKKLGFQPKDKETYNKLLHFMAERPWLSLKSLNADKNNVNKVYDQLLEAKAFIEHIESITGPMPISALTLDKSRFEGAFIGSKIGDMLGFGNGAIEVKRGRSQEISDEHRESALKELMEGKLIVSDDTIFVQHFYALVDNYLKANSSRTVTLPELIFHVATSFEQVLTQSFDKDFLARAHGMGISKSMGEQQDNRAQALLPKFNERAAGCGAAMYLSVLGLFLPNEADRNLVFKAGMFFGYITHSSPVGYLGGACAALFSNLAQDDECPFSEWPTKLIQQLDDNKNSISSQLSKKDQATANKQWDHFRGNWKYYQQNSERWLSQPDTLDNYDQVASQFLFNGKPYPYETGQERTLDQGKGFWGGSGHDSTILCYHVLLHTMIANLPGITAQSTPKQAREAFDKLPPEQQKEFGVKFFDHCFNGGDSDSIGAIAGFWFGEIFGDNAIPEEYRNAKDDKPPAGLQSPKFDEHVKV